MKIHFQIQILAGNGGSKQFGNIINDRCQYKRLLQLAVCSFFFVMVLTLTMIFMILPRFATMYKGMGRELPGPTQTLLDIGALYADNLILIGAMMVGAIALTIIWLSSEAGQTVWDGVKLKLPLVGSVVRHAAMARFLRSVGLQLQHGIPAVEALRSLARSVEGLSGGS